MNVYYIGRKHPTKAKGFYNEETHELTVYAGTIVSNTIADFAKKEKIIQLRKRYVIDGVLQTDVTFASPTSAAIFVVGYSADGLKTWRVDKKVTLQDALSKNKQEKM